MIRILPFYERLPKQILARFAVLLAWLFLCAEVLARTINQPDKIRITVAVALVALPIALLFIARIPILTLCAYAALVPFSSILVTSGGETLTKLVGIFVGISLIVSIIAKRRIVRPSHALIVLAALTIYSGLTICWAIDPALALSSYGIYLSYISLYVVIALYPATPKEAKLVLISSVIGGISLAWYGAYLFSHGQQVYESRLGIGFQNDNWIDSNEYAAALLMPIAIVLMQFLRTASIHKKAAWLAVLLLTFYGFVASGSRGGMFALGAMVLFLMATSRYRKQLVGMLAPLGVIIMSSPIGLRLFHSDLLSADLRADIWKVGIASLRQYWLSGAGIGNFTNAYAQFFLVIPHAHLSWDRPAHSILIGTAVELGVIGLILVLALWYTQFAQLLQVRDPNEDVPDLWLALQAGIVGLFVAGLSLDLLLAKYTWIAFSLIALIRASTLSQGSRSAHLSFEKKRPASSAADLAIKT